MAHIYETEEIGNIVLIFMFYLSAIEKDKSKKPNRRILRDSLGFGSKTKVRINLKFHQ